MAWLLDSAVYIGRLRAGEEVWQQVLPMVRAGELYGCGIVRAEVLRGIKNLRLKKVMEELFDITPEIPTDARMWRHITDLAWQLDREMGGSLPLTDIAIASCAIRAGAILISPDQHFDGIPGLRWQTDLPTM
jgi:predicted nucleic acid-binding protein